MIEMSEQERKEAQRLWNDFVNRHSAVLTDVVGYVTSDTVDISGGDWFIVLAWFIRDLKERK
jgi:hypothetical protein